MIEEAKTQNSQVEDEKREELANLEAKSGKNKVESKEKAEKKTVINDKSKPALHYVVIMFSVALLLLILSFFMQQRNHGDLIDELNTASMNMQTIVNLELELETMEDSLTELQENYDDMKVSYDKTLAEGIASKESLIAMESLMNLQTLYLSGEEEEAKILLDDMESKKLYSFLSAESSNSNVDAPFTIYEKIKANLK